MTFRREIPLCVCDVRKQNVRKVKFQGFKRCTNVHSILRMMQNNVCDEIIFG